MAIKVGDIYREEIEETSGFFGKTRLRHGSLYEVTEATPSRVKLVLWDGSGPGSLRLEPIEVLARFQLWRSAKWQKLSQEELFEPRH